MLIHTYENLLLQESEVKYTGSRRRSSPSEGDPTIHRKEQNRIIQGSIHEIIGITDSGHLL